MLSVAFSVSVNAEDVSSKSFKVKITDKIINDWGSQTKTVDVYPNNDAKEFATHTHNKGIPAGTKVIVDSQTYLVEYTSAEPLLKANRESTVSLYNIFIQMILSTTNGETILDRSLSTARILLYYSDGSFEYIDNLTANESQTSGLYNITASFTPKNDVQKMEFIVTNNHELSSNATVDYKADIYIGEYSTSDLALSITIQSEEAGLLNGIIEWLKSIKNGITNVFESIGELPGKIWNYIENGLKSLFVPDPEVLHTKLNEITDMAKERLGILFQVSELIITCGERISHYDDIDSIEIPETTINLDKRGNNQFTFGGYTVPVVPDNRRFQIIADTCKTVTGIMCTVLFINGIRKRYDEVMEATTE